MSKQWQLRRGTTVENDGFTGAQGELTVDTDKKQIRLHDGVTQGGKTLPDIEMVLNAITPDYAAPVTVSTWPYTIPSAGWIKGEINASNNEFGKRLVYAPVEGSSVAFGNGELSSGNYQNTQSVMFVVERGGVLSRESSSITAIFYPMKGLNS